MSGSTGPAAIGEPQSVDSSAAASSNESYILMRNDGQLLTFSRIRGTRSDPPATAVQCGIAKSFCLVQSSHQLCSEGQRGALSHNTPSRGGAICRVLTSSLERRDGRRWTKVAAESRADCRADWVRRRCSEVTRRYVSKLLCVAVWL